MVQAANAAVLPRTAPSLTGSAAAFATLALIAAFACFTSIDLPLTRHMAQHIVLMSVAAPLSAALVLPRLAAVAPTTLAAVATAQIAAFFAWHSAAGMGVAATPVGALFMQATLFIAAVAFWRTIFAAAASRPFLAALILALTGKIFCLMAALFVLSPRALHALGGHSVYGASMTDQQLAGLLMLAACPLTYLVAAFLIVVRTVFKASPIDA